VNDRLRQPSIYQELAFISSHHAVCHHLETLDPTKFPDAHLDAMVYQLIAI
jgi:hypothetical protein